ncbi:MAG: hypothetical protein Q9198_011394, partial [Flavoplaca austrocitrina]
MRTPTRPQVGRKASRVPGGFETDEELSPIKTEFDDADSDSHEGTPAKPEQRVPSQPSAGDESSFNATSEDGPTYISGEGETFDEREIRRKLMDIDSSFYPDTSPAAQTSNPGADDTYVRGGAKPNPGDENSRVNIDEATQDEDDQVSPDTPTE